MSTRVSPCHVADGHVPARPCSCSLAPRSPCFAAGPRAFLWICRSLCELQVIGEGSVDIPSLVQRRPEFVVQISHAARHSRGSRRHRGLRGGPGRTARRRSGWACTQSAHGHNWPVRARNYNARQQIALRTVIHQNRNAHAGRRSGLPRSPP